MHARACLHASVCALMCELCGLRSLSVSPQFEKKEEKESSQQPNHNQAEAPHAARIIL